MIHYALVLESDGPTGRREILLRVAGDADAPGLASLESFVQSLPEAADVHLDLSALEFAGAAFLGFLVGLGRRAAAAEARVTIGAVSSRTRRLLDRFGLAAAVAGTPRRARDPVAASAAHRD